MSFVLRFEDYGLAMTIRNYVARLLGQYGNSEMKYGSDEIRNILVNVFMVREYEVSSYLLELLSYARNKFHDVTLNELVNYLLTRKLGADALLRARFTKESMDVVEFIEIHKQGLWFLKEYREEWTGMLTKLFNEIDMTGYGRISRGVYLDYVKEYFGEKSPMSKLTTDNFSLSASLNLSRSSTGNAAARLNSDYSQIQTDNSNSPVNRLRLGGSSQTYSNVSNSKKMIEVQGDDTKGKRSWDSGNGKKKYDRNEVLDKLKKSEIENGVIESRKYDTTRTMSNISKPNNFPTKSMKCIESEEMQSSEIDTQEGIPSYKTMTNIMTTDHEAIMTFKEIVETELTTKFKLYDVSSSGSLTLSQIEDFLYDVLELQEKSIGYIMVVYFDEDKRTKVIFKELLPIIVEIHFCEIITNIMLKRTGLKNPWEIMINIDEFVEILMENCFFFQQMPKKSLLKLLYYEIRKSSERVQECITLENYQQFLRKWICGKINIKKLKLQKTSTLNNLRVRPLKSQNSCIQEVDEEELSSELSEMNRKVNECPLEKTMREFSKLHLQSEIKEEDEEREQDGYRFGGGLRNYKEGTISPNFSNLISETKLSDVQNFGYDGRTTKSSEVIKEASQTRNEESTITLNAGTIQFNERNGGSHFTNSAPISEVNMSENIQSTVLDNVESSVSTSKFNSEMIRDRAASTHEHKYPIFKELLWRRILDLLEEEEVELRSHLKLDEAKIFLLKNLPKREDFEEVNRGLTKLFLAKNIEFESFTEALIHFLGERAFLKLHSKKLKGKCTLERDELTEILSQAYNIFCEISLADYEEIIDELQGGTTILSYKDYLSFISRNLSVKDFE